MEFLNYNHLFYFWQVAKLGGFSRAAEVLRVSQSSISLQVKLLEDRLETKLFMKRGRNVTLTETGELALQYCEAIFMSGQEMMQTLLHKTDARKMNIRVGSLAGLSRNFQIRLIEPLLKNPNIHLQLVVGDSRSLARQLQSHELDLVISSTPIQSSERNNFFNHIISQSRLCVVASSSFKERVGRFPQCLTQAPIFLPSTALEARADFDSFCDREGLKIQIKAEADDIALLRLLALTGEGFAVVPKVGVAPDLKRGDLKIVHEFENIAMRFYAVTRERKIPIPEIQNILRRARA